MSLFYNNYQRLSQENADEIAELSAKSWNVVKKILDYINSFDVSLFELEVIKKDLIGIAREADMEQISFVDKIGMPEEEFCDTLVREGMKHSYIDHLLPMIRNGMMALFVVYTLMWWVEGFPSEYGITGFVAAFTLFEVLVEWRAGTRILGRMVYKDTRKKKKGKMLYYAISLTIWYVIIFRFPDDLFAVHGNGRVIFVVLLLLAVFTFFGNNYYWDKCSEKYNWK